MEYVRGSGGFASFENLKTYLNDASYDIQSSSDGKYYTSNFNRAIINKNETKEIYIKGNIVDNGDHSLDFDIYRVSDVNITDESGNVVIPQAEQLWNYENSGGFKSGNPWYDGYRVRVVQ